MQRDVTYQLTDEALGQQLSFLFNVYDTHETTGLKRGTAADDTTDVKDDGSGTVAAGRTMTNTAFRAMTWDATWREYVEQEAVPNPKGQGLYELNDGVYSKTSDKTVVAGKTYYARSGTEEPYTYTEAVVVANPKRDGLYERSGSAGAYVYTKTEDTTPAAGKTYYAQLHEDGGWRAGTEHTAEFSAGKSDIRSMRERTVGGNVEWYESARGANELGTGPSTVLAWDFGEIDETLLEGLFGQPNILSYISTNSAGVTNLIQLHAWDRDNDRVDDQTESELTFGKVLFSDDDATEPKVADFRILGTGTNMVKFGEVAKATWAAGPTETFTGMSMGTAGVGEVGASASPVYGVTAHSKNAEGTIGTAKMSGVGSGANYYAQVTGTMQGTDWSASTRYFEWALQGTTAATRWLVDTLTFKTRVTAQGPTRFTLTVTDGQIDTVERTPSDGSSANWTAKARHNPGSGQVNGIYTCTDEQVNIQVNKDNSYLSIWLVSPAISLNGVTSGSVTYDAGAYAAVDRGQTLKLQACLNCNMADIESAANNWVDVTGTSLAASEFKTTYAGSVSDPEADNYGKKAYEIDFEDVSVNRSGTITPVLNCTGVGQSVTFRWLVTRVRDSNQSGFTVNAPTVTTVAGNATERVLVRDFEMAKDESTVEGQEGTYSDTTAEVSISFPAESATGTARKTFRLYAYRATADVANEEAVAAGTAAPNGSTGAHWGINDLTLLGIVSGPKGVEVTDQDIELGSWTNQMEVMDGLETGYDTRRSGLWMADDGEEEYAQKIPEFTVVYPKNAVGNSGASLAGEEVWSSTFNVSEHADAAITYGNDGEFTEYTDGNRTWTLTGGATVGDSTTESGRSLKFPGSDSQAGTAVQTKPVSMSGKVAISAQATARVRSTVAASSTDVTPVNGFKLKVELLSESGGTSAERTVEGTFTATRAWKDFTVGPFTLENNDVGSIRVTIEEETSAGTGLEVDRVEAMASAFATMDSGAPANAVQSARLKLAPPALNNTGKELPLSETSANDWKYGMVAKIYDYDHDRTDDALCTSRTNAFLLYDDDEAAPQAGRQYGGPFGVTMNGTLLASKNRVQGSETSTRTNLVWSLSDHALAESAGAGADIGFMLDFYDFSGWRVTKLEFQPLNPSTGAAQGEAHTVVSGGTLAAAGTLGTVEGTSYGRTTTYGGGAADGVTDGYDYGAANVPSAAVGWTLPAAKFYQQHKSEYEGGGVVTNAVNAWVTDLDQDRADATEVMTTNGAVGNFRLLDQDVRAPQFRAANDPTEPDKPVPQFRGVLVATNVPSLAAVKAQTYTTADAYTTVENPYALGGYPRQRTALETLTDRSLPALYDSQLLTSLTDGNHFMIAADLVDPTEGAKGRSSTGLRRGTAKNGGTTSSSLETGFAVTNSYLELVDIGGSGATVDMAAAYNGDWSDSQSLTKMPAATRYSSWVWSAANVATATNTVGEWLPSGVNSRQWRLRFHAYDDDTDRGSDQAYAELNGPALTVRDDDTVAPGAPGSVALWKSTTRLVPGTGDTERERVPWVNDTTGLSVHFTEAEDGDGTEPEAAPRTRTATTT
jgi:hypothetical protein